MAEAARETASNVAAQHLVNGDRLSGYAWEMQLWDHKGRSLNPLTIGPDRTAMRSSFQDLWPRSPQAGSTGGHDTEAVVSQLSSELNSESDVVVVLLTNSAASVAGKNNQKIIGENSPAYQAALDSWARVRTSSTTGASVQLGVQSGRNDRTFDAVIVLPQRFQGAALEDTRSALISKQVRDPSPFPDWWVWVLVGAILGGATILVLRARNNRPAGADDDRPKSAEGPSKRGKPWSLKVSDRTFNLNDTPIGEIVCVLCGPEYPLGSGQGRDVSLKQSDLPPLKLLTITREKQGLKLTPENDAALSGELPVLLPYRDDEYRARLSGRASRQNLPPRPYQTEIVLTIHPVES